MANGAKHKLIHHRSGARISGHIPCLRKCITTPDRHPTQRSVIRTSMARTSVSKPRAPSPENLAHGTAGRRTSERVSDAPTSTPCKMCEPERALWRLPCCLLPVVGMKHQNAAQRLWSTTNDLLHMRSHLGYPAINPFLGTYASCINILGALGGVDDSGKQLVFIWPAISEPVACASSQGVSFHGGIRYSPHLPCTNSEPTPDEHKRWATSATTHGKAPLGTS